MRHVFCLTCVQCGLAPHKLAPSQTIVNLGEAMRNSRIARHRSAIRCAHRASWGLCTPPLPFPRVYAVLLTALACPFPLQDADVSTPAKCKKILRDEGVQFAPDATHARLALLAQTAVRKKRKLTVVMDNEYAEEIKVATSMTVSELVDVDVQKVISERDEVGYCVNVRCIINNITEPWTVVRCGRNKCTTIIKSGNALCGKCGGVNNDAYSYIDYLFQ